MAVPRLQSIASHLSGISDSHPFDPLTAAEIEKAVSIVNAQHDALFYNAVTLQEPRKAEMQKWLKESGPMPRRIADVVAIGRGSKVYDGLVDIEAGKLIHWEIIEGVQPMVIFSCNPFDDKLTSLDYHGRLTDSRTCGSH
jgi:primary-amine oxidase